MQALIADVGARMEALIFDVGGVLLVPHADVVGDALSMSLSSETAERAHYFGVHAMDLAEDEASARRGYLVAYTRVLGIATAAEEKAIERLAELWNGSNLVLWRQRVSGSLDGLRELAKSGRKLGIVSNADGTIEEQLRRNEICQVGEGVGVPVLAIIDSGIVGVAKPSADIFRHALEPLDVAPEAALYVGDTVRYDVRGARAAGLAPVHFDPLELCLERGDHPHVRALSELSS